MFAFVMWTFSNEMLFDECCLRKLYTEHLWLRPYDVSHHHHPTNIIIVFFTNYSISLLSLNIFFILHITRCKLLLLLSTWCSAHNIFDNNLFFLRLNLENFVCELNFQMSEHANVLVRLRFSNETPIQQQLKVDPVNSAVQ